MTRKPATDEGDTEGKNLVRKAMDEGRYEFAQELFELECWYEFHWYELGWKGAQNEETD